MGLTQAQMGERIGMTGNSVARMERGGKGGMIITPPMALLISFVAREAGVERRRQRASNNRGDESKRLGSSRNRSKRRGK
jgi:hypothetical protein